MPPYIDQSSEDFQYRIRIDNLPPDVSAKHIQDRFGLFGNISKLYLKRRVSRESSVKLPNPYVILFYDNPESIDAIMANRPFVMNNQELFVRRCLPKTRRYPYEPDLSTNKILVCVSREHQEQILPNDEIILNYLKSTGGHILRSERFTERTLFVEFDDYDPVDIVCLARPHFIENQLIEIEKCSDEQQARRRAQYHQKNRSSALRLPSTQLSNDTTIQSDKTISSTLNINEQTAHLARSYEDMNQHIEHEHERIISELKNQLEQAMKDRIRFRRLQIDCEQEQKRLTEENRRWQKLYSDSLLEKPRVQREGEQKLAELTQEYTRIEKLYNQL